MTQHTVTISKATEADFESLAALLASVNLPSEGVAEHLDGFLVARDTEGKFIGCAGLERYGQLGLLRSVAVSPHHQKDGLGLQITRAVLDRAAQDGVAEVVLLTTTARDFFARKFGFVETQRSAYNAQLSESAEWQMPCCSSAVLMKLTL